MTPGFGRWGGFGSPAEDELGLGRGSGKKCAGPDAPADSPGVARNAALPALLAACQSPAGG